MKKYHLVWIIGIFVLIIGVTVIASYANQISERYPHLSFLISGISLEPTQSIDTFVNLNENEKIFVTIAAQPLPYSLYFSISNLDNSYSKELVINDILSFPLNANHTDSFNILVGNMGHENVNVNAFTTKKPILDDKEILLTYGSNIITGSLLLIIGFFLIIIGIVIFFIMKKRNKKSLTNK